MAREGSAVIFYFPLFLENCQQQLLIFIFALSYLKPAGVF